MTEKLSERLREWEVEVIRVNLIIGEVETLEAEIELLKSRNLEYEEQARQIVEENRRIKEFQKACEEDYG